MIIKLHKIKQSQRKKHEIQLNFMNSILVAENRYIWDGIYKNCSFVVLQPVIQTKIKHIHTNTNP